jgi:transposase
LRDEVSVSELKIMSSQLREFRESKTELKVYVTHLWKAGTPISQIAKDTGKSRETIYRWIKQMDHRLSKSSSRRRQIVDEQTKFRILEMFILLKCPKMPRLKKTLNSLFHIQLSESQLRRLLKKWGMNSYKPSSFFDSILRQQAESLISARRRLGKFASQENSEK